MIGALMLLALIAAICIGFPMAFTLLAVVVLFGSWGLGTRVFDLMVFQTVTLLKEEVLAAVPLFIFMGYVVEQSGLMERLFRAFRLIFAPLRGSLYLAVIFTAIIFAMATGIVGAAVTVLGIMAGNTMIKSRYDPKLSAGVITAGGSLGILIPPSVMLIVMGPVVGVPTTTLFAAAVVPGLMLSATYAIYTLARCHFNPALGPALPPEEWPTSAWQVVRELVLGVIPVVIIILATLGTILAGLATPTDAGAVGAFAVLLLTIAYRRLTLATFKSAIYSTLEVSSMILILVAASNFFGSVFSRLGSAGYIAELLLGLSLPPIVMLLLILAVIFVLGWPLEWVPIVLIVVPILLPLVTKLGIDLTWFCTLVAVCLQTAWLSPPVALSAYFLKGVVPDWELTDIYAGMVQFMGLQLAVLALIIVFPELALWFPRWLAS